MRIELLWRLLFASLCLSEWAFAAPTTDVKVDEGPVRILNRNPGNETMVFAASELRKYVGRMAGREDAAVIVPAGEKITGAIEVGLFSDFGFSTSDLKDPALDDAIRVEVAGGKGRISGSNPRSVLLAVYRFLEANGCRWLRPGEDGELVPKRPVTDLSAQISDQAALRFRGTNNCCTYSLQNILDKIDWAPKVGMNMFFNEFSLPKELYGRWYEHEWNSLKAPTPLTEQEVTAYHRQTILEIKRRGLIYHAIGHGWSGTALGLTDSQSNDSQFRLEGENKKFLAQVNGVRGQRAGFKHTDLCYGNPEVRRRMVQAVVDYATEHPEVDLLHVWMADGMNNDCECDLCKNTRPSDFYLMQLNEMDRELTRRGIKTRLVFLAYGDLLWPPEKERFKNPGRFVMMFAPSRMYDKPYDLTADGSPLPPFRLNHNTLPTDEKQMMAFFHAWRKIFSGEVFVFDYHFIGYHYFDPGQSAVSAVLAEDIRRLEKLGIGGYVSCQNLRVAFPTGYPIFLHARLLWNPAADTEELAREYFETSFGEDGQACRRYLEKLSVLFDAPSTYRGIRGEGWTDAQLAQKLREVPALVESFRPVVERNLGQTDRVQAASWRCLSIHLDYASLFARTLRAKAQGDQSLANTYGTQLLEYLQVNEDRIQPAFDLWWFMNTMGRVFQAPAEKRGGLRR